MVVAIVPSLWEWELAALQLDTDRMRAAISRRLNGSWTEVLRDQGIDYRTRLVSGRPGPTLLRLAHAADALCIVIAREAPGRVRVLTGAGVAGYLHRHAQRTVVEVRAAARPGVTGPNRPISATP